MSALLLGLLLGYLLWHKPKSKVKPQQKHSKPYRIVKYISRILLQREHNRQGK